MAIEVSPSRVKFICKAPGCGKECTSNTIRAHWQENKNHRQYGYKVTIPEDVVATKPPDEEEEGPTVVEARTETATSKPSASVTPITVAPHTLAKTAPEPTYFAVKLKLPVSLWQYYDALKGNYPGDFNDFIAEAAIDGIIAAMREYCEECGAKVDKCPYCQADLPLVELAMVVQK
jgi:hypothetical protein